MLPAAATSATHQDQVLLEFEVYRILGNISGEMSGIGDLRVIETEKLAATRGGVSFFTLAKLTLAGVEFRADDSGWTWDGKDRPPSGSRVETIASPKIMVLLGESFVVAVGSQQPIEYFEKRPDGLFELKKVHGKTGLTVSSKVEQQQPERIILRDLTIRLQSIEKREPIEGASLDVGYPIVRAQESLSTVAVKPGGYHGMLLGSEAYGSLLLRLRVRPVLPGEMDTSPKRW